MLKLCYGTVFTILYLCKSQKVTIDILNDSIFNSYNLLNSPYDSSLPGKLKRGVANIPKEVVDLVRKIEFREVKANFEELVIPKIKQSSQSAIVLAIQDVLNKDSDIPDSTIIGYEEGYEKSAILNSTTFNFSELLVSVFYYVITEVDNTSYRKEIKLINKDFMGLYEGRNLEVHFESKTSDSVKPLKNTLNNKEFDRIFRKVNNSTISNLSNLTTVELYITQVNNLQFNFAQLKEYLVDNIGSYVLSRVSISSATEKGSAPGIYGRAYYRFQSISLQNPDSALGELMLYIFLEQELGAPKIMSKIEFNKKGINFDSKSDGVYLLCDNNPDSRFHQLVFGASGIVGNLEDAVDQAFEKILAVKANSRCEYQIVENSTSCNIYDKETTNYLISLLVPHKAFDQIPEMSFGIFLGYTLDLNRSSLNNTEFYKAVEGQLLQDIRSIEPYITKKIQDNSLEGYCFYFYVIPFNHALKERTEILMDMFEEGGNS